jgi:drug/metabolite transporter (DMT)-like permease
MRGDGRPGLDMSVALTLLTVLCVVGISIGQMLFKKAALVMPAQPALLDWVLNPWLIAALVLYGITTLAWVAVLRSAPLHLAYPFMGLAFVFVPLLGAFFLNEPLVWQTLVGGALILAGITVAAFAR